MHCSAEQNGFPSLEAVWELAESASSERCHIFIMKTIQKVEIFLFPTFNHESFGEDCFG